MSIMGMTWPLLVALQFALQVARPGLQEDKHTGVQVVPMLLKPFNPV